MQARHRLFIAPRTIGSLSLLASLPLYLAVRGAPTVSEVTCLAWLIAPLALTTYVSRTGRFEMAVTASFIIHALFAGFVALTCGVGAAALIWLLLIPIEAALLADRRIITLAVIIAAACLCVLLIADAMHLALPVLSVAAREKIEIFSWSSASLHAVALALGIADLSRVISSSRDEELSRYRLLTANISDVVSCHGRNGAVKFISPAVENLLGIATPYLLDHGLFDRIHVTDRPAYLTAISAAVHDGAASSVELRIRRDHNIRQFPGSDFIWVEMRCRPMQPGLDDTGHGGELVAVMRDIHERKCQQLDVERTREAAEQADAAKSRFLATMSHELRTPLNAIIGFSEMISQEDELMIDKPRRAEYARLIHNSGQHLLSVVNGILDMSKMESGTFEIAPEPFAPRPVLVNCCDLLALKARENAIDLIASVAGDLPELIADPQAFQQVALNLISNAVKFTGYGGAVVVSAVVEDDVLTLQVTDNGVGIADDDLKQLGKPFFQAGRTYQRRHEGTGLGLSIVKNLVEMHGGALTIRSRLGEGTVAAATFPLKPLAAATTLPKSNVRVLNSVGRPELDEQKVQVRKRA